VAVLLFFCTGGGQTRFSNCLDSSNSRLFSNGGGPHLRRELTLMPRFGFARPQRGMAAGASVFRPYLPYPPYLPYLPYLPYPPSPLPLCV
jgi:hypothetical protein